MSIHKVAGDGECLFNSVAYGIIYLSTGKTPKNYKILARKLRKETVKALTHKIRSLDFTFISAMSAEYNNDQNVNLDNMIKRARLYRNNMRKSCTWGGQIELQVLGPIVHYYGYRGIKVYNANNKRLLMSSPMSSQKNPVIHIVLHGVRSSGGGGVHFDFWNKTVKYSSIKT